jgi:hypothetical protein
MLSHVRITDIEHHALQPKDFLGSTLEKQARRRPSILQHRHKFPNRPPPPEDVAAFAAELLGIEPPPLVRSQEDDDTDGAEFLYGDEASAE